MIVKNASAAIRVVCILGAVLLSACATRPDPANTAAVKAYEEANDPIEPLNRYFFELNRFLDIILIKPLATWYHGVLPDPAQTAIFNALNNFNTPTILANDLLQGEWNRAGTTITRFGINTTVGVGGLMDPATKWGHPIHSEDFGQTLAVWGVGEGPYLYLPLLGPRPPRDLTALLVDRYFDPLTYIYWDGPQTVPMSIFILRGLDLRARNLDTLDQIERTSVDYYATMRSLYRQNRASEISNGDLANNLPDIDDLNFDTDGSQAGTQ